jgi:hypothetical protein
MQTILILSNKYPKFNPSLYIDLFDKIKDENMGF